LSLWGWSCARAGSKKEGVGDLMWQTKSTHWSEVGGLDTPKRGGLKMITENPGTPERYDVNVNSRRKGSMQGTALAKRR